jgi:hypothetical protein
MNYPFSLFIPLVISLCLQGLLWASNQFFIPWMDRTAILWIALGGATASTIFLVLYRVLATDMKQWNISLVACSVLQFGAIGNSLYFVLLALR